MTPTIQKSVQRVLQVVALFAFIFALTLNVETNINGTVDLGIDTATAQVQQQPVQQVSCLVFSVIDEHRKSVRQCKCYRDAPGPDIFEGFQVACEGLGEGCNKAKCRTTLPCYCV